MLSTEEVFSNVRKRLKESRKKMKAMFSEKQCLVIGLKADFLADYISLDSERCAMIPRL